MSNTAVQGQVGIRIGTGSITNAFRVRVLVDLLAKGCTKNLSKYICSLVTNPALLCDPWAEALTS